MFYYVGFDAGFVGNMCRHARLIDGNYISPLVRIFMFLIFKIFFIVLFFPQPPWNSFIFYYKLVYCIIGLCCFVLLAAHALSLMADGNSVDLVHQQVQHP